MMKKNINLKKHIIASVLVVSTMFSCFLTQVLADTDVSDTEVNEAFDFSDFMPSCTENVKNTYKERYHECSELVDSIVDSIISDVEFIEYFENEGPVAFEVVADALDDVLESKSSLYSFDNESYFSTYNSYRNKQLYSYYDGPAAVVQALIGSGCINFTTNKSLLDSYQIAAASEMGTNSTDNTSIYKITAYMQKKYAEKFGQDTDGTFQTRVFNSFNADNILGYITTSLAADAVPILRIPDRSVLYEHRNETGSLYVNVVLADEQGEYIVYTDPTMENGMGRSITYDELESLTDSGNVWLSTYCYNSGPEFPLSAYPAGPYTYGSVAQSYFTVNGEACSNHNIDETNCKYFDGGWQCYAFANYIYYVTTGNMCSTGTVEELNLTGQNSSSLKGLLQGLPTGTHIRVNTRSGNIHSMAVIRTSEQGITVYHANFDLHCGVYYDTFTWEDYAYKFPDLLYYVAP